MHEFISILCFKSSQECIIYLIIHLYLEFLRIEMCVLSMQKAFHCLKLILIHSIVRIFENIINYYPFCEMIITFFLLNGILALNLLLVAVE